MKQSAQSARRQRSVGSMRSVLRLEALEPRLLLSASPAQEALDVLALSPALFVENQGQWADQEVRFAHHGMGTNVALTDAGPAFQVFRPADGDEGMMQMLEFSTAFVGGNAVEPTGIEQAETLFNFYVGDDPSAWVQGAPSYQVVGYEGVYDGVDFVTRGLRSHLKYEFHVAPGADWQQIQVRYDGIAGLSLADDGSLVVDLGEGRGTLVDDAPIVYQEVGAEQVAIPARFVLVDSTTYSFELTGTYDPSLPLVIDPALTWSTYMGGGLEDRGNDIALNAAGDIFVTGHTRSTGWVSNGGDTTFNGSVDAFAGLLTPAGGHAWTTYIGGSGYDTGNGIAVDIADYSYIAGYTESSGWTNSGYDTTYGGAGDGFVVCLTPTGAMDWSTYLGGTSRDEASSVAVTQDTDYHVYVAGETQSDGWTSLGYDTSHNGAVDAFAVELDGTTGAHFWSTYLGGTTSDWANDIAVDTATGDAYITGGTNSTGWVAGGFDTTHNGVTDAFVASVSSAGAPNWSTYLGGAALDRGDSIACSGADLYVAGYTESVGWVAGGFDTSYNGMGDGFLASLTTGGTAVNWSTYIGGTAEDDANGVAPDTAAVFVTGETASPGWTFGGFDNILDGTTDAYAIKVSNTGGLNWASYLGGGNEESGNGVAVDGVTGDLLVVGSTTSPSWATGGYDTTHGGDFDAFVARIADTPVVPSPPVITSIDVFPDPVQPPDNITIVVNATDPDGGTVVLVDFYQDDGNGVWDGAATETLLGTDNVAADGWSYTGSTAGWLPGVHTLYAVAEDDSTARSTPATDTVTVGAAKPVVTSFIAAPDPVTRPNPFALTATAVADPARTVAQVGFYRDGNNNGVYDERLDPLIGYGIEAGGVWGFNGNATGAAGWTLGPHTLFARARDDAGTWGDAVATLLTVDGVNAPPIITALTAAPNPVDRPSPLLLTATGVADPDGLVTTVEFYHDDGNGIWDGAAVETLLGRDSDAFGGYNFTASTAGWALGPHTFFARAQDNDGDYSAPAAAIAVVQNPVIQTGTGAAKSVTYWDPDGTKVQLKTKNTLANLQFGGNWVMVGTPKKVTLFGAATLDAVNFGATNMASRFSIKAKGGDGMATVGDVTIPGSFGRFDGKTAHLVGDFNMPGNLAQGRFLRMGSTAGPAALNFHVGSLGKLDVTRWIENVRLESDGTINSLTAGGVRNSSIFVAVAATNDVNGDGVFDLPNPATDFAPGAFALNRVRITGKLWDSSALRALGFHPPSFVNSNIAARNIGRVDFAYAAFDNGGSPFGIACRAMGQFRYRDDNIAITQSTPLPPPVLGDLEVRIA